MNRLAISFLVFVTLGLAILLAFWGCRTIQSNLLGGFLLITFNFLPFGLWVQILGLILAFLGPVLFIWARRTLGQLYSGNVSVVRGQPLVDLFLGNGEQLPFQDESLCNRDDKELRSTTPKSTYQNLSDLSETYLAPLYWKAMESQRPDAMIKDEKAVALVTQNGIDFSQVGQIKMNELLQAMRIIFTREMDRYAREFIHCHPYAVVVHIGCGLDSRFERVVARSNQVEWYDLDLPEVIELRRRFIGDEHEGYYVLGCSVLEEAWLEAVKAHSQRPSLFLAETVFVYFTEEQVKSLVLRLRDHFPGSELVFDGWRPFEVWLGNRYLSKSLYAGLMHWGFWRGQELEGWGDGIRLLDEWGFFDQPEPRLKSFRWMAPLFRLFKPMRIFHFRLGE